VPGLSSLIGASNNNDSLTVNYSYQPGAKLNGVGVFVGTVDFKMTDPIALSVNFKGEITGGQYVMTLGAKATVDSHDYSVTATATCNLSRSPAFDMTIPDQSADADTLLNDAMNQLNKVGDQYGFDTGSSGSSGISDDWPSALPMPAGTLSSSGWYSNDEFDATYVGMTDADASDYMSTLQFYGYTFNQYEDTSVGLSYSAYDDNGNWIGFNYSYGSMDIQYREASSTTTVMPTTGWPGGLPAVDFGTQISQGWISATEFQAMYLSVTDADANGYISTLQTAGFVGQQPATPDGIGYAGYDGSGNRVEFSYSSGILAVIYQTAAGAGTTGNVGIT